MADPTPKPQTTKVPAVPLRTPMFERSSGEAWPWNLTRTWILFFQRLGRSDSEIQDSGTALRWCSTFNLATGGDIEVNHKTVWAVPEDTGTLAGWTVIAATPPVGANLIIDIEDETAASIFGATKIVIPAGDGALKTGAGFAAEIKVEKPHTKRFRAFATQIGSTTPGSDITVNLYYK
jgi:hypothetical protein